MLIVRIFFNENAVDYQIDDELEFQKARDDVFGFLGRSPEIYHDQPVKMEKRLNDWLNKINYVRLTTDDQYMWDITNKYDRYLFILNISGYIKFEIIEDDEIDKIVELEK